MLGFSKDKTNNLFYCFIEMKPLSLSLFLLLLQIGLSAQNPISYPNQGTLLAASTNQQHHYFLFRSSQSSIVVIDENTKKDSVILLDKSWISEAVALPTGFLFYADDDVLQKNELWYFDFKDGLINTGLVHGGSSLIRPFFRNNQLIILAFDKTWNVYQFDAKQKQAIWQFSTSQIIQDVFVISNIPVVQISIANQSKFEYWLCQQDSSKKIFEGKFPASFQQPSLFAVDSDAAYISLPRKTNAEVFTTVYKLHINGADSFGRTSIRTQRSLWDVNKFREPYPIANNGIVRFVPEAYSNDSLPLVQLQISNLTWRSILPKSATAFKGNRPWDLDELGNNRWMIKSKVCGIELAVLKEDTMFEVADYWKGPSDGIQLYFGAFMGSAFYGDSLFFLSSNGKDGKWYLSYQKGDEQKIHQLMPIPSDYSLDRRRINFLYPTPNGCFVSYELTGNTPAALVYYAFLASPLVQTEQNNAKEGEWMRQFSEVSVSNNSSNRVLVSCLLVNQNSESYISLEKGVYDPMMDADTKEPLQGLGSQHIIKLDKNGNRLWDFTYGFPARSGNTRMGLQPNGDVVIAGCAWHYAVIGNDSNDNNNVNYLLALDANTGQPKWSEWFMPKPKNSAPEEIEALTCDNKGNIYMVVKVTGTQFSYDNINLVLSKPDAHVLIKLNEFGSSIWAHEIKQDWVGVWTGTVVKILVDETQEQVITLNTQSAYYNTGSTCDYTDWYVTYSAVDAKSGKLRWKRELTFSDLGGMLTLEKSANNFILSTGYFRGFSEIDQDKVETPRDEDCHQTRAFRLVLNPLNGEVLYKTLFSFPNYLPVRTATDKEVVWEVGLNKVTSSDRNYHVSLLANDLHGRPFEPLKIEKATGPGDFGYNGRIAIQDGYVWISDLTSKQFGPFYSNITQANSVSIVRLKLPEVASLSNNYNAEALEEKLFLGPNPFTHQLQLSYPEKGYYRNFEVYDLSGKLILEQPLLADVDIEKIDMSALPKGLFIFKFIGKDRVLVKKLIKE